MVSGLGGDGEGNHGDGLTIAAKMVMERWTNYSGEDGDGAKLQMSRRWSTVVEPNDAVVVMNEAEAVLEHVGDEAYHAGAMMFCGHSRAAGPASSS